MELQKILKKFVKTSKAKTILKESGFYVDDLWHCDDIQCMYDCTEEEAQKILGLALNDRIITKNILNAIEFYCNENNYNLKKIDKL